MNTNDYKQFFNQIQDLHILVIGDIMIDSYLWGRVERISPEAPIPIVTKQHQENRLGGAANVALNIKSLGATPVLCALAGEDAMAKVFFERMKYQGLSTEGIIQLPDRRTTVKTRVISGGQHLLRVDDEDDSPANGHLDKIIKERIRHLISQNIDAIIFEDYDKGMITPSIIEFTTHQARERGIPVLVDPKKRNFDAYTNLTVFKPNFKELKEGLHADSLEKGNIRGIKQLVNRLMEERDIEQVLVTLSEYGVYIASRREQHHLPAEIRDIADVSGAGDTLIATASLCVACGLTMYDTAHISNMAGGLVCEKVGVVPIQQEELLKELLQSVNH